MSRLFEFKPCNKQVCHNIAIIDDSEVESDEKFIINVMRSNGLSKKIKLMTSEKTITIVDTDGRLSYIHSYMYISYILLAFSKVQLLHFLSCLSIHS